MTHSHRSLADASGYRLQQNLRRRPMLKGRSLTLPITNSECIHAHKKTDRHCSAGTVGSLGVRVRSRSEARRVATSCQECCSGLNHQHQSSSYLRTVVAVDRSSRLRRTHHQWSCFRLAHHSRPRRTRVILKRLKAAVFSSFHSKGNGLGVKRSDQNHQSNQNIRLS